MWDLSSPTREQIHTPCIARQILNHWTAREVPPWEFLKALPKQPLSLVLRITRATGTGALCLTNMWMEVLFFLVANSGRTDSPGHTMEPQGRLSAASDRGDSALLGWGGWVGDRVHLLKCSLRLACMKAADMTSST